MRERVINLILPEFAFVESSGHDGDTLAGRNVILHTRTASVIEIFSEENVFPKPGVISFNFVNTNSLGLKEHMTALLHYTATLDQATDKQEIINRVLIPAARWFCDYCDWEEKNVIKNDYEG